MPVDLPAAEENLRQAAGVGAKRPATAEGQLIEEAGHQPMRDVLVGQGAAGGDVVRVLVARAVVDDLRDLGNLPFVYEKWSFYEVIRTVWKGAATAV